MYMEEFFHVHGKKPGAPVFFAVGGGAVLAVCLFLRNIAAALAGWLADASAIFLI